jgi:hypothetical protein
MLRKKLCFQYIGSPILSTEREQAVHPDPVYRVQSGQDIISEPQQQPGKLK